MMATKGHLSLQLAKSGAALYARQTHHEVALAGPILNPQAGPKDPANPSDREAPCAKSLTMLERLQRIYWMLEHMPRMHRHYCLDRCSGEPRLNQRVLDWLMETGIIPSLPQLKAWSADAAGPPPERSDVR
jgi:hypothetical protein